MSPTKFSIAELRAALYPSLSVLALVAVSWASTGELNRVELAAGVAAVAHGAVAFFVTNAPGWEKLKAWAGLVTNAIGIGALWIETGTFDRVEIVALGTAVLLALATGVIPNGGRTNSYGSLPPRR